jgi:hypothetical protein
MIRVLKNLFFFIVIFVSKAYAQQILVKGTVLENDSVSTIPFAYVVNKNTKLGITTDENGIFNLKANYNDTLLISYLGKVPVKINLSKFSSSNGIVTLKIILMSKPQQLKEVTIRSIDFSKEQRIQYEKFIYKPQNNTPLRSPISFLYDRFSKEARSREKLREFYEQDLIEEAARMRLTDQLIVRLTGNPSMNFDKLQSICHISNAYIATALEYDLYLQIRKCYKSYMYNHE